MARFQFDADDHIISDQHGDLSYDDTINAIIEEAVSAIEEVLWNMVDDMEYVVSEEVGDPSSVEDDEEVDEDWNGDGEYEAD